MTTVPLPHAIPQRSARRNASLKGEAAARLLRVAVVYPRHLLTRHAGGVLQYIRGCVQFASRAERYVSWCRADDDAPDASTLIPNLTVRTFCGPRQPTVVPETLRLLWHLWRRRAEVVRDADLLFLHESEMVLPWLLWRRRPPIVLVLHNCMERAHLCHPLAYRLLRHCTDWVASHVATRIICVSQTNLSYYQQRFPARADRFVHRGTFADDSVLSPMSRGEAREHLGLPADARIVCYAGRLHRQKRVLQLLSVFARLCEREPKALLCLAGDGPLMPEVRARVAELGLTSRVRFMGILDHHAVGHLFRAADVSALLTNWEGMPLALLESLASGTPAVVSDVSDVRKYVRDGENGFLVRASHSDAEIAALFERAFADGSRMGAAAVAGATAFLASAVVPGLSAVLRETAEAFSHRR